VGTGSGALAIVLARAVPGATVLASDLSADALALARDNAERLTAAVTFVEGDLAAPLAGSGPLDLVVANLPYVPTADIAGLAPEVRCEPRLALDGGPDGLDLVRRLVAQAPHIPCLGEIEQGKESQPQERGEACDCSDVLQKTAHGRGAGC
jgi:release factor glutamine methyltransferase